MFGPVASRQEVEHSQIRERLGPREDQSGADAMGAGNPVGSDAESEGGRFPHREFQVGHAGLQS
jgi:hypothetical protein